MKKILTILLLTLSLSVAAQTERGLYVKVMMDAQTLSCDLDYVIFELTKRRILVTSSKVSIDGEVVKRKIGKYNSMLIFDKNTNTHYFVTAIQIESHYGIILAPCNERHVIYSNLPFVIVSTADLCK